MPIISHNPATKNNIKEFDEMGSEQVDVIVRNAREAFITWHETTFAKRTQLFYKLADSLEKNKPSLAEAISIEMGKPIKDSEAEIEKSALCSRYYAENGEQFLKPELYQSDSKECYVRFDPLGVILAIMPWNYPVWQVIRFAAPALMAGNVGLLKHASNVPQVAIALENLFKEAGFPEGVFQTLLIRSNKVEEVINNPNVKAVTLTGSELAGSEVASIAGKTIKKTVLELGGSDPFILFEDGDLESAAKAAVESRMLNSGQSCIAAKRFIVHSSIHDQFVDLVRGGLEALKVGNPLKDDTEVGPLSSQQILDSVKEQVAKSISMGAKLITGGMELNLGGYYYAPTLLTQVKSDMPVFSEETFGPVMSVMKFQTENEALLIANESKYGLGASIWSSDIEKAKSLAIKIEAGSVFINGIVRSDPRLPFGGIKISGYGRELGSYGIKEFINVKTVLIK